MRDLGRVVGVIERLILLMEENARELISLRAEQQAQVKRLAQLQADLDALKRPRRVRPHA